ncbi:hypothetical protein PYCCODRAFT_1205977 [Trametes coccinea BRFM310]|uniref:Uncharacterized protein n=1 Tax=Trametes coccinea (strain BRFM310) TaxID=1353009 RepID=A0A1Y2I759_TRAC3|nr:hypothetical protein PYCCODRAFT_1205977 [Trametes coccinea BRFM310]
MLHPHHTHAPTHPTRTPLLRMHACMYHITCSALPATSDRPPLRIGSGHCRDARGAGGCPLRAPPISQGVRLAGGMVCALCMYYIVLHAPTRALGLARLHRAWKITYDMLALSQFVAIGGWWVGVVGS